MFGRRKIAMIVAEFLGAFTLSSVMLSLLYSTNYPYFAAVASGLALAMLLLVFSVYETGFYNPAVTVALWTVRKLETTKALVFISAQALGGIVAWSVNSYLLNTSLRNIANKSMDWRIFAAEAIGALVLTLGITAVVSQGYADVKRALTAGGALVAGVLLASLNNLSPLTNTTQNIGIINPAVAVGVQSWSFVYAAAPILGAVVAANVYLLLFSPGRVRVAAAKPAAIRRPAAKRTTATRKRTTTRRRK